MKQKSLHRNCSAMVHQGPKRLKGTTFKQALPNVDLVLTSYAVARQDAEMLQAY